MVFVYLKESIFFYILKIFTRKDERCLLDQLRINIWTVSLKGNVRWPLSDTYEQSRVDLCIMLIVTRCLQSVT